MSKPTFMGARVLEEGSYLAHNCLKFYLDKELRYPVRLSLNDMLPNIKYGVEKEGVIDLMTALAFLQNKETFNWLIYGQYIRPDGQNDVLTETEVFPSEDMEGFMTCKVSKQKLKVGDRFKILFTFTRNEAFEQFLKKPKADVAFGVRGRGRRSGLS